MIATYKGVLTYSHLIEKCGGCPNPIPAGQLYMLTWTTEANGEPTMVTSWHQDCQPANAVRVNGPLDLGFGAT